MKRRHFLPAAATLAAAPLIGAQPRASLPADGRHLIELRTYEMKFGGGGQTLLLTYLREVLGPHLVALGCSPPRIMKERGDSQPAKLWVLISYPSAETYLAAQDQPADASYDAVGPDKPLYNRFSSQLLQPFVSLPTVADVADDAGLFELRTYEGYSEDAVRRKVAMFNTEEIPLFYEVGLTPVFFGKMIAGPYRPALVYMLQFKNMEARSAAWGTFGPHPAWKKMSGKPEYANSVSNIRRLFLEPV
ncbi:NIPSNAP family protein [Neolewinella antarctica]|uniref:NIPSNAP domain-containing protein n=1 Tax=Neolewinella antarctica TaxID=442734 RepID=A0ABX0XCK0_9BACT|nr:NIPSNAP family protein [Neolewinella antarctica]NJC26795.1 hypothetical protein [Neolewinella antarctica]